MQSGGGEPQAAALQRSVVVEEVLRTFQGQPSTQSLWQSMSQVELQVRRPRSPTGTASSTVPATISAAPPCLNRGCCRKVQIQHYALLVS
ncbi:unnamed protein product [Urochloa humidicola]